MSFDWQSCDKSINKRIIRSGKSGHKPYLNSKCLFIISSINLPELLCRTSFFHSDYFNRKINLTIGDADSELDRELEKCLTTMFLHELSEFQIKFNRISINFQIELIDLQFDGFIHQWSYEKKYQLALKYKENGISWKNKCDYHEASNRLSLAFKLISCCEPFISTTTTNSNATDTDKDLLATIIYLKNKIIIALAWCHLQNRTYENVIELSNLSLDLVPDDNLVAKKLRGLAYVHVKEYEKSFDDFAFVLKSNPHDKQVLAALKVARAQHQIYLKQFAEMSKKMLNFA